MDSLQEIVTNYPLIMPAVSFAAGAAVGSVVTMLNRANGGKSGLAEPYCTYLLISPFAVAMTLESFGAGFEMYLANLGAAMAGDYLAGRFLKK